MTFSGKNLDQPLENHDQADQRKLKRPWITDNLSLKSWKPCDPYESTEPWIHDTHPPTPPIIVIIIMKMRRNKEGLPLLFYSLLLAAIYINGVLLWLYLESESIHPSNHFLLVASVHGLLDNLWSILTVQNGLAMLVNLQLGDLDIGGRNTNKVGLSISLVPGDSLNVDNPLLAKDRDNLSFTALEMTTNNLDFIILSNRNRSNLTTSNY